MPAWSVDVIGVVVTWIAVAVAAWYLGLYMVKVFRGERTLLWRGFPTG